MNKTRLQMRADLRLDLKDSGALWSDDELNRSIERAFSDLSRFLPDEKIYEDSLQFAVTGESVKFPTAPADGQIVAAESLADTVVAGSLATIDGQPDMPRLLRYIITDANDSIQGVTIIVVGIDKDDQALQEVSHYSTGDDKQWMGKKCFKAVYSVEFDQITGNADPDMFELGTGDYTEVWVYLANSPIKWGSESATDDGGTAITRNTDFYIDYANGRVKAIEGGSISAIEICTFAYSKSQIGIDLSDLPGLIRVQRVEYPVGSMPQNFVQFDVFGKWVVVTGSGESEEQEPMAEGRQFRVYYDAEHHPPTEYAPGTPPGFLEDTVKMAAAAYALYIYALKQEHQVTTDLTSARTALSNATTAHSAFAVALTNLKKYLDNNGEADAAGILKDITDDVAGLRTAIVAAQDAANTELDNGDFAEVATHLSSASSALDKVATFLENNTSEDSKSWLTKITTDIVSLRTAMVTAQDAANSELDAGDFSEVATHLTEADSALDKVVIYLENNTSEDAKTWLTKITTDITGLRTAFLTAVDALNTYLDSVATDLTSADDARANYMGATANYVDGGTAPDIKKYLDDGDATLNTVPVGGEGQDVPRAYREYAQGVKDSLVAAHEQDRTFYQQDATARTNAAMGFANEAAQRLSNLRTYIEQAVGWISIAGGFTAEATERIAMAAQIVNREAAITGQAAGYINEAASRADNLRSYIDQADAWGRIASGFVAEASQRIEMANQINNREAGITNQALGYVNEAASRIDSLMSYIEQSAGYVSVSNTFAREAEDRLSQIRSYIEQASEYELAAATDMALADRFRAEADERKNEVQNIWRDRKQYIGDFTAGSLRQMPSYD